MSEPETKMGRPKKREKVVAEVAESMGIALAADVLSLEDMSGFPQLQNEKPRNQAIMACIAAGMSQCHVAQAFGVSQPAISVIVKRIDPNGMFKLDPKRKRAIMTQLAEGRAMSAITSISWDDLMDLDADKRANVAGKMMKISQDLNQSKHTSLSGSKLDTLLSQLGEADVVEGEYKETGND